MLNTVIIDDERKAREDLENMISSCCHDLVITGQAGSVREGIEVLNKTKPDLVFLDVSMPDGTGFDLLEKCGINHFKVVFVTAFEEFAIKAFRFSAVDYLLKPVIPEELESAVAKSREALNRPLPGIDMVALMEYLETSPGKPRKITLKTREDQYLIELDRIVHCEASQNYTRFFLDNGETIFVSRPLREYEELLAGDQFYRVHQSHLINASHVIRFNTVNMTIQMSNGHIIPVAQRKKDILKKIFK